MDISAYQHMNIRMSTRGKRPLRNLTPSDKVRAIQRIHNGETKASVSRDIGVPESTLRGWCKNEQKLRFMCRQLGTEQLPTQTTMENPPEKRIKFESGHIAPLKFPTTISYEELAYSRLPLISGMDFAGSTNSSIGNGNAILDRITLNEFLKNNHMHQAPSEDGKPVDGITANWPGFSSLPVKTNCSHQLTMVHNLGFLSLLNPGLAALSGISTGSFDTSNSNKSKVPLRTSNVIVDGVRDTTKSNNAHALVFKNWARDPSENMLLSNTNNNNNIHNNSSDNKNCKRDINDTNNNDVKSKNPLTKSAFPKATSFSTLAAGLPLPPLPVAQMSNFNMDTERNNVALLEWCNVFNASLNFLALAAAAAALQPPTPPVTVNLPNEDTVSTKDDQDQSVENLLYKQLTRTARRSQNSFANATYLHSDVSNDSYFDSEPEDLSIRSTTSKVSSPANSRSQSPAKSTATSSDSAHSDTEQ